jgi:hypothetical protein
LPEASDIDRLIEEGLSRYGSGDLDGALAVWERVLAEYPENTQAKSYVQYVRSNYDLLAGSAPRPASELGIAPFPLPEEPDYQIEITEGTELPRPAPRAAPPTDSVDEGWLVEESTHDAVTVRAPHGSVPLPNAPLQPDDADDEPEIEVARASEDEVEQPDVAATVPPAHDRTPGDPEFHAEEGTGTFRAEESTGSFVGEGTPFGFTTQTTGIRKRELGFVQPASEPSQPEVEPSGDGSASPPLEIAVGHAPTIQLDDKSFTSEAQPRHTMDLPSVPRPPASVGSDHAAGAIASPDSLAASSPAEAGAVAIASSDSLPASIDLFAVSQAELMLSTAPTREMEKPQPDAPEAEPEGEPPAIEVLVSAPTRELGLRQRAPTSDDTPTREADVRAFREQHARQRAGAAHGELPGVHGGLRPEPSLESEAGGSPDPLDSRSAEILAEIDREARADETTEDRTRRRIGVLCEKALAWNAEDELDKAVTAIDLALAEDPGSALAQKLVHRNRDTIMTVFQNYLGPLERQPQLALPLHELASAPLGPRAAFLLSRIDGSLTIDEILDVSGMPRLEAFRHLCQLFLRGILK